VRRGARLVDLQNIIPDLLLIAIHLSGSDGVDCALGGADHILDFKTLQGLSHYKFRASSTSIAHLLTFQQCHYLALLTEINRTKTLAVWTLAMVKLCSQRVTKRGFEALLWREDLQLWCGGVQRALGKFEEAYLGDVRDEVTDDRRPTTDDRRPTGGSNIGTREQ